MEDFIVEKAPNGFRWKAKYKGVLYGEYLKQVLGKEPLTEEKVRARGEKIMKEIIPLIDKYDAEKK